MKMIALGEVKDKEVFMVAFVDVDVEATKEEENMMDRGSLLSKELARITFSVITARDMVI